MGHGVQRAKRVGVQPRGGGVTTTRPFPAGVSTLAIAHDKTYWFGGEGGIWHMAGETLTKVELPPRLANRDAASKA